MSKLKPQTIQYVNVSDVFEDNRLALTAFEDSGKHSYGDNDLTLVLRDTMINNMKDIKKESEDKEETAEIDVVIEALKELDAATYIDLEN